MLHFMHKIAYSTQEQSSAGQIDLATCATISLAQAAQILGIHRSTAWDLYKRDEFPVAVLKIGNRLRVTRSLLEAFLTSGISTINADR